MGSLRERQVHFSHAAFTEGAEDVVVAYDLSFVHDFETAFLNDRTKMPLIYEVWSERAKYVLALQRVHGSNPNFFIKAI